MAKKNKTFPPLVTIQMKGEQGSARGVFMKWISAYLSSNGFGVSEDEETFSININDYNSVKAFHISEVTRLNDSLNANEVKAKKIAKKGVK